MVDVTDRFSLSQVDHHELLQIFVLRYKTCWRVSKHKISFPASKDYRLELKMRHGQIEKISTGKSLSEKELESLLDQVDADLKDDRIAGYGREILFAHRPVTGTFRFTSLPMQILSAPPDAPRALQSSAEHPFVLEYPIRGCQTPEVRTLRRRKNAVEWAWVLNVLLHDSVKYSSSRSRQMWATTKGKEDRPPFWAYEFYIVPSFHGYSNALSEQSEPLLIVPSNLYFGGASEWGGLPLDALFLPDNLDALVAAFLHLDAASRRRFLRSAAAIYTAHELWNISISNCFLACVQAIETLVDRHPGSPCPTCHRDTSPGPTKLFREFVEKYCTTSAADQSLVRALYSERSALAHGHYLFQFDEAPFSTNLGATVSSFHEHDMSRSALSLAKEGARNWLMSKSRIDGTQ